MAPARGMVVVARNCGITAQYGGTSLVRLCDSAREWCDSAQKCEEPAQRRCENARKSEKVAQRKDEPAHKVEKTARKGENLAQRKSKPAHKSEETAQRRRQPAQIKKPILKQVCPDLQPGGIHILVRSITSNQTMFRLADKM